jgi:hypothetical protein
MFIGHAWQLGAEYGNRSRMMSPRLTDGYPTNCAND